MPKRTKKINTGRTAYTVSHVATHWLENDNRHVGRKASMRVKGLWMILAHCPLPKAKLMLFI